MSQLVNSFVSAVGASWCQLMHPDPMWPVNGQYQCRVCLRKYRVAWEQNDSAPVHHHAAAPGADSITPVSATTVYN